MRALVAERLCAVHAFCFSVGARRDDVGDFTERGTQRVGIDAVRAHHGLDQRIGQHVVEGRLFIAMHRLVLSVTPRRLCARRTAYAALRWRPSPPSRPPRGRTRGPRPPGPLPSPSRTSTSVMPRKPSTLLRYGSWKSSAVPAPE